MDSMRFMRETHSFAAGDSGGSVFLAANISVDFQMPLRPCRARQLRADASARKTKTVVLLVVDQMRATTWTISPPMDRWPQRLIEKAPVRTLPTPTRSRKPASPFHHPTGPPATTA